MPSHLIKYGILGSGAILVQTLGENMTRIVNVIKVLNLVICGKSKSGHSNAMDGDLRGWKRCRQLDGVHCS